MADRYWVGGTASWDGTAGTKWSATSGGAGGASVPTSADDVFFNASSTGTVTIATGNTGAKSINCTGFTGTITGTANITVSGNVTLVTGMTYSHTGTVTFNATATLITAGKIFSGVEINGSGITATLGDALNISGRNVTLTLGTFDTANYNVTCGNLLSTSTTNIRTLTLGSSTVSLSGTTTVINFATTSNFTLNAGTSQITLTGAGAQIAGGDKTFYNMTFAGGGTTNLISNTNTFNNLTLNAPATLLLNASQTVNGTLTCAGASSTSRNFLRSNTLDTARTITAATVSANDCNFRDITISGAAAPISPTRAGDEGGNSGITFPAAKTVYRVGTNTNWAGSSSWATSSGGTGSDNNYPLPQDTAVINNDTALTGTLGITTGGQSTGTIDFSNRTTGITFNLNAAITLYGSFILGSGVTITGTQGVTFSGRGTMDFTGAGKTITFPITLSTPSGNTLRLGDAFNSTNSITLTQGTINANNYNLTCTVFSSNNSNTRTITMGSGLWTLTGTSFIWDLRTTTNLTFNVNTANILLTNTTASASTFASQGLTYNKLTLGGGAATAGNTTTISGNASTTISELASTRTGAYAVQFNVMGTIGTWSITGSSGNVVSFNSDVSGTRRTFSLTNVTSGIDYLNVKDIGISQTNRFYVGANSTDGGNNSNVYFTAPPVVTTGNMMMLFH